MQEINKYSQKEKLLVFTHRSLVWGSVALKLLFFVIKQQASHRALFSKVPGCYPEYTMSHRTNHEDKHRDYARHRSNSSKYSSRTPAFPHEKQPKPHATIHLNPEEQHSATTLATASPPKGILVSPRSVHSDYPRPVLEAMPEKEPTETDYSELAMKALTHDWIRSSQYTKTCHEYYYSSWLWLITLKDMKKNHICFVTLVI